MGASAPRHLRAPQRVLRLRHVGRKNRHCRVWGEIMAGDYVAQAYAAPGLRNVRHEGAPAELKVDVRLYTYDGEILLTAARLYRGQTTNMRTPGGGFAPVLIAP